MNGPRFLIKCRHPNGRRAVFAAATANALGCGYYTPVDAAFNTDMASLFSCLWCVFGDRVEYRPPPTAAEFYAWLVGGRGVSL